MNKPVSTVRLKLLSGVSFIAKTIRPLLGTRFVCIYPLDCMTYAESILISKPIWKALPLITLRVLSCNPITAFIRWIKN